MRLVRCSCVAAVFFLSTSTATVAAQTSPQPSCAFGATAAVCEVPCATGDAAACRAGGYAYEQGLGTPRDAARATQLYLRACDLGSGPACLTVSDRVKFGVGTERNPQQARALLLRSCEIGLAVGCAQVAQRYEYGWDTSGTDRDDARAVTYYQRACNGGDTLSCAKLKEIACENAGGAPLAALPVLDDMFSHTDAPGACGGGTILRMELDITGDGKPELFLASSQLAGNAGTEWAIYSPTSTAPCGHFDDLFFHYLGFRFDASTRLFVSYHRLGGGEGSFAYQPVGRTGFGTGRDSGVISTNSPLFEREWALITRWLDGPAPVVLGADLDDLIRSPVTARWTNMRTQQPAAVAPTPLTAWGCR